MNLTGCAPEREVRFETIEKVDVPGSIKEWKDEEPALLIIASDEDVKKAERFITKEAYSELRRLDFTTHFAIIAFRGWQHDLHEGFLIHRIVRKGNTIAIYAHPGHLTGKPVVSSPYHLVKVRKEGKWRMYFIFKLYFDKEKQPVVSVSHFIP